MTESNRFPLALRRPDPDITIRPVQPDDSAPLQRVCLPETPITAVEEMIARALKLTVQRRGGGYVIVGDAAEPVQGYGQLTLWNSCAELSDLIVAESQRGRGWGTALVQYLCQQARKLPIDCVEIGAADSNPRALDLYQRLGFSPYRTIQVNLGQGEEPVIYLRLRL